MVVKKEEKKKEEIEVKDRVEADELASIMGGEMSEKEKERKKLFEEGDDDSSKEEEKKEEDDDESKEKDTKDGEKDEEKDSDDTDEEGKAKDESKESSEKDDDEGDDKDSDKDKDEEVDERQALKDEVEALRKTINEMLTPLKVKKEEDEDDEDEEKKEETKLERKSKDYVFITQKELDGEEFVVDAKFLNEFGNRIANQVKKDSLTSTAEIVKSHISETQKFRDLASDFYSENPDLNEKKVKSFVAYRVSVLASEHPDWDYEKLFSKLGKDVREKLGLKAQAEKIEKKRKDKPAFVRKPKGKPETEKEEVSGTLKEIGELISKRK